MTSNRTRRRLMERLKTEGIENSRILQVMEQIPRHLFVDEALAHRAYEDTALPIGFKQTISQPYIVALMTQEVMKHPDPSRVLEIGTGSGYQTAILSQLVDQVFTMERIEELMRVTRQRLYDLRCYNIKYSAADGTLGWPEQAPFDAIVVTAAPESVPGELTDQLSVNGRLIIPVGGRAEQRLQVLIKTPDGMEQEEIERVRFVPLLAGRE